MQERYGIYPHSPGRLLFSRLVRDMRRRMEATDAMKLDAPTYVVSPNDFQPDIARNIGNRLNLQKDALEDTFVPAFDTFKNNMLEERNVVGMILTKYIPPNVPNLTSSLGIDILTSFEGGTIERISLAKAELDKELKKCGVRAAIGFADIFGRDRASIDRELLKYYRQDESVLNVLAYVAFRRK